MDKIGNLVAITMDINTTGPMNREWIFREIERGHKIMSKLLCVSNEGRDHVCKAN
jgi:hypothetical protein